jgi:hypothetical protein
LLLVAGLRRYLRRKLQVKVKRYQYEQGSLRVKSLVNFFLFWSAYKISL